MKSIKPIAALALLAAVVIVAIASRGQSDQTYNTPSPNVKAINGVFSGDLYVSGNIYVTNGGSVISWPGYPAGYVPPEGMVISNGVRIQ